MNPSCTSNDEVEHFLKVPALAPDSNALEWWKENAEWLPTLFRVGRQLLYIPATSVPSEMINFTAGNTVTKKRTSLTLDNVDMLVFLNKKLLLFKSTMHILTFVKFQIKFVT